MTEHLVPVSRVNNQGDQHPAAALMGNLALHQENG